MVGGQPKTLIVASIVYGFGSPPASVQLFHGFQYVTDKSSTISMVLLHLKLNSRHIEYCRKLLSPPATSRTPDLETEV